MGRMLDTLKLGEGRRAAATSLKPEPGAPVQECVVDWEIGTDVPYVEVGGPGKKVELSPGLVQHSAQPAQPPHISIDQGSASVGAKIVNLTETAPMLVSFKTWPESPTPAVVAPEIITHHQPEHPTSKEYALLLDKVLTGLKTPQPAVLLLVGLKPHVGTSTVVLNLASAAAQRKHRVVVLDAHGSRPSLAHRLGRMDVVGLEEVIVGTLALEQAVLKTPIPALYLLPAGAPLKKQRSFSPGAMAWVLSLLREQFDLILIDGPALEQASEVALQAPQADAIYLVLPQDEEPSAHRSVAPAINRMGGRLCGLIHTQFNA